MTSRRKRRAHAPRPIVYTRDAEARMRAFDTHHFTELRLNRDALEAVVNGEARLGGRVIRGRRIA
jgi:hypothetical protein